MIGKVIQGYFDCLQGFFNPFKIHFDTMYSVDLEDLKMYSQNAILRQQFDYDRLKSAHLSDEVMQSLRNGRDGVGYNCLLYKHSALKRSDILANNDFIYVKYENSNVTMQQGKQRQFVELDRPSELYLLNEYKEYLKKELSDDNTMKHDLHDIISGEIKPQSDSEIIYERLGVFCDLELDCMFFTTQASIYEDFQLLYNSFLLRNPPAYIKVNDGIEDIKWGINTRYEDINQAEQLDYETNGNILTIGFSVTLTTTFLSSFVKRNKAINSISIFSEIF